MRARQKLEIVAPLALGERVLEFELTVEMILNHGFVAAGHENEMLGAGFARLIDHVLISGRSTIGSISFGTALVAGRNRVPRRQPGKRLWGLGSSGDGGNHGKRHALSHNRSASNQILRCKEASQLRASEGRHGVHSNAPLLQTCLRNVTTVFGIIGSKSAGSRTIRISASSGCFSVTRYARMRARRSGAVSRAWSILKCAMYGQLETQYQPSSA